MRLPLACLLVLALLAPLAAASANVSVVTSEIGRITSYFDQYWVVNVDGNISVTNPTDRDLYDVVIRYDLASLTIIETSGTGALQQSEMIFARIPANSTVTASYNIVGITLSDPALPGKGVLYSAMVQFAPVIYSDTFGQLQKGSLENASLTGRPGRLVSVTLRNPTGFQFTIDSLRVIKTPDLDPNTILDEWWLVNGSSVTVDPDSLFVRDILDLNSAEGQVYWLVADVFISRVTFTDFSNVTRFTETNLTIPPELLNYTVNDTNASNRSARTVNELYAKKLIDQQIVTADEPVTVSVLVNNFAQRLISFRITDELPPGFRFEGGDGWSERDGVISYTGVVSAKNAVIPSYVAQLTDRETAGFDYFSRSQIDYTYSDEGKILYTDAVPFIRQYLPAKRLYVQKRLRYLDEDEVAVTISIQNFGSSPVSGILLREYLEDQDVFSEITQLPSEKGLWEVGEIKSGDSWEVTYRTTASTQLNILPGVFGVANADVLKSLVLENVISAAWEAVRAAALEVTGIVLLIGLPILYFFVRKKSPDDLGL